MKQRVITCLIVAAALPMAFSQDFAQGDNASPPSVTQTITVSIPERLALHVTETEYSLDLDSPWDGSPGDTNNFRPYVGTWGSVYWPEGEGCFMLPKHVEASLATSPLEPFIALTNALYQHGVAVANYPAVVLDGGDVAQDTAGNYLKGSLVCINQKIVQKFANVNWRLSADVTMPATGSIGTFGLVDVILDRYYGNGYTGVDGANESDHRYLISSGTYEDLVLAYSSNTTGGWLDDRVTEILWFDGTETPGEHSVVVTYTLTSP